MKVLAYISKGDIIEYSKKRVMVEKVVYCDVGKGEFSKYAIIELITPDGNIVKYNSNYDKGRILFQNGDVLDFE